MPIDYKHEITSKLSSVRLKPLESALEDKVNARVKGQITWIEPNFTIKSTTNPVIMSLSHELIIAIIKFHDV